MAAPNVLLCVAHTPEAPGATTASGLTEHALSTQACRVAALLLEDNGVRVRVYSGTRQQKVKAANAKGASYALLVEPHFNANGSNVNTRGYQTIYAAESQRGKLLARHLANAMQVGFAAIGYRGARWIGPTPVPGQFVRLDDLPILTKTRPVACITEYLFHTNAGDCVWIEKPDAGDTYGRMLAAGILNYLKEMQP